MTTARQRQANKLNAQKATGPKSARGKSQVSQNAVKHRLSTGLPPHLIEAEQEKIMASVMMDGFDSATARELSTRIIDVERNVAFQRQLFSEETVGPKPHAASMADQYEKNAQEIESALLECPPSFRKNLRSLGKSFERSVAMYSRMEANRRQKSLRYFRRSSNQLIKLLRQGD